MKFLPRLPGLLLIVAALAVAIAAALGLSLVPVWVVALVSLGTLISRQLTVSASAALALLGFLAAELLLLRITPYLGFGMSGPNILLWTAVSVAIGVLEVARPRASVPFSLRPVLLGVAASASALLFLAVVLASRLVAGIPGLGWSTRGDSVGGLRAAHSMLADGGIRLVAIAQPTPLPFGMASANMEGGRLGLVDDVLVAHDLERVAEVWAFVVALSCVVVGLTIARRVRTAALAWSIPVVVLASSSMLAWYVIGVQFDFGFMNSAFAIMVLLAAWLAYESSSERPLLALAGLFAAALAMLAIWSPLTVCVAGLGIALFVLDRRGLAKARIVDVIAAVASLVALVGYGVIVTIPSFFLKADFLGSNGGFPPIGPGSIFVIAALAGLAAVLASQGDSKRSALGAFAILALFLVALAYLLAQRHDAAFAWGYYPAKFAWTVSILLLVVIMSLAVHLITTSGMRRAQRVGMIVGLGALIASLLWGPVAASAQFPLLTIMQAALAAR